MQVMGGVMPLTGEARPRDVMTWRVNPACIPLIIKAAVNSLLEGRPPEGLVIFFKSKKEVVDAANKVIWHGTCSVVPNYDPRRPNIALGDADQWARDVGNALTYGIVIHYRGVGEHYSGMVAERLASKMPCVVLCTPTLAEGLNIRSCNNVIISGLPFDATLYTYEQMHGRAGRWERSATCYTTIEPPRRLMRHGPGELVNRHL
jgi:replicative superfamily II helicase